MIIYKITNLINGKIYVGQTVCDFKKRMNEHFNYPLKRMAIGRAIIKYGKENFHSEIIEYCTTMEDLNKREIELIESLNSIAPNGYNLRVGGSNGRHSELTKKKMSDSQKGKKKSDQLKELNRLLNTGKIHSQETREKRGNSISLFNKHNKEIIGVSFDKRREKYIANYTINRVNKYCGEYDSIEFAKMAGDFHRLFLFGDNKKLNYSISDIITVFNFLVIIGGNFGSK